MGYEKINDEFGLEIKASPLLIKTFMIKNRLLLIISFYYLFTSGCIERRDFCDCMDLTKAVTDVFTLSKEQSEAKRKGCQWIQDELSPVEIAKRFAQCNAGRIESKSNPAWTQTMQLFHLII
jgi:hypothetical protein